MNFTALFEQKSKDFWPWKWSENIRDLIWLDLFRFDLLYFDTDPQWSTVWCDEQAMAKAGDGAGHRCGFQRALAKAVGAAAVDLGYLARAFLKTSSKTQNLFQLSWWQWLTYLRLEDLWDLSLSAAFQVPFSCFSGALHVFLLFKFYHLGSFFTLGLLFFSSHAGHFLVCAATS